MPNSVLLAEDAFWRRSGQMGVLNTDLAKQLGSPANTTEMTDAQLADLYPDGAKALPPELSA